MLQYTSIDIFVRYYSVGIYIDAQTIIQNMPTQKELIRFACLISCSIDPHRPWRLENSNCINDTPSVYTLENRKEKFKRIQNDKKHTYEQALDVLEWKFGNYPPQNGSRVRVISKK